MSHTDRAAAAPAAVRRGSPLLWVVVVAVLLLAGGGAGWYFVLGPGGHHGAEPQAREAPLPFTLPLKPFVISVASKGGQSHFVQLGPNLQLPGSSAGDVVNNVLPQVQDAMRQTILAFKSEDLQSVDGINKVREAMLKQVNEMLAKVLGPERIAQLTGGDPKTGLVSNIYFSTLIVE